MAARSSCSTTSSSSSRPIRTRGSASGARPFSDTEIPTVVDHTLAPEGIHTVSMFSQWVPADWADDEDDHRPELEAYADRLIEHFDEVAPGFKDSVMARQIIGPKQMQEDWGLIGGNIFHGELTVDQLFHMRPRSGTPTTARRSTACTRPPAPRMQAVV